MGKAQAKDARIVVVGGGAGGLELVTRLARGLGRHGCEIILVDSNLTHIWKPLLHEVAAGALDANLDEVGYGSHAFRWGYRFVEGALESIDRDTREIVIAPILDEEGAEIVSRHRVAFDYLVVAIGSVSNDFRTPGVRENCVFLDDRNNADRFRRKLLNQCLRVARITGSNPQSDIHVGIVIVGGGATGVELAAELYSSAIALRSYGLEGFDKDRLKVTLIEAGPRILPALPEKLAASARAELETLGVRVLTGMPVVEAGENMIRTRAGETIKADLMVWAAGVKGADFLKDIGGLETNGGNQLIVRPTLQSTRDDRIFAIGDCCAFTPPGQSRPTPPRAQAAHQMAETAFINIKRLRAGKPLLPFVYRDRGSLVSLARFGTVGSLMGNLVGGRLAIEGRLARIVYLSLYRMHLIAIHGWGRGLVLIVVGHVNQVIRPKLKLH
jgi:NADH dehydrogenase